MTTLFSAFYLPPDTTTARSVGLCAWAGGVLLPMWSQQRAWGFFGGSTLTSGAGIISLSGSGVGYADACGDAISGAWAVQYSGNLYNLTSGVALVTYALPASGIFTGVAFSPTRNTVYAVNSSGQIYAPSGSGVVAVGTPFAQVPAWSLVASGSSLMTLLAAASGIGTFTLSATGAGTSGFVAAPMTVPTCLAAAFTGSGWAVGGWSYATLASGFSSLDFDPIVPTNLLGVTPATNKIGLYTGTNETWTLTQTVSGTGAPTFVSWSPNGVFALATDPVSGKITVLSYSGGTIAVTGTLSLTNASALDINANSISALVCQPTQNQATALNFGASGWALGAAVTGLPGAAAVVMTSISSAAIGFSSGVAFLSLTGTTWAVAASAAVPFTPKSLAVDVNGSLYATGTQGTSGYLSVLMNQALAATVTWAGSGVGAVWRQGQIVVGDPANSLLRVFGLTSGAYMQGGTAPAPAGLATLAMGTVTLFAGGTAQTLEYQFGAPYQLPQLRTGAVSVYASGVAFNTASLGVGQWPTAMTYDASGTLWAATLQNTLYAVNSSGAVISSGSIGPIPPQPAATPVGISAMLYFQGSLYAASSLYGALGVPSSTSFIQTDTGFAVVTDLGQEILV